MMFVQQLQHLTSPNDSLEALIKLADKMNAKYAGILHDKDKDVEPHVHIFFHFENAREISAVANKLNVKPQYIEKWDENADSGFAYLCHRTEKARKDGAYQYDPNDVISNFDYAAWLNNYEIKATNSASLDIDHLLDLLYVGAITKTELESKISGSEYAKHRKHIEDVWAKHLQVVADKRREERKIANEKVNVIWIYGKAGTGKTRFATEIAAKKDINYYITGSSKDPFQRYSGEDIIIYDEARPNDIPYSDLLRLLDPFGADASAPSRYYDKPICAGTFIITTPYNPFEFYSEIHRKDENIDTFEQLLRRLSLVIRMDENEINSMMYIDRQLGFIPQLSTARPNTYIVRKTASIDYSNALYNSFFKE